MIFDPYLRIECQQASIYEAEIRARITGRVITFRDEYEYKRQGQWLTKYCYGLIWPCGCTLIYRWVGQPLTKDISKIMDNGLKGCRYHMNVKDKKLSKWLGRVVEKFLAIQPNDFEG
jgi:hypothetical protein